MTFSCSFLDDNFLKGPKPVELIAPVIFQMDWWGRRAKITYVL